MHLSHPKFLLPRDEGPSRKWRMDSIVIIAAAAVEWSELQLIMPHDLRIPAVTSRQTWSGETWKNLKSRG